MLDEAGRLDMLAALGIDVYHLRAADEAPIPAAAAARAPASVTPTRLAAAAGSAQAARSDAPARLVVACAAGVRRDARLARHIGQVVRALGVDDAAVAWAESAPDGSFTALPLVDAYLMLGSSAARHGAALLPIERQNSATIVVAPEPGELLRDRASRRALWQMLKPLARRLREDGGAGH